MVRCSPENPIRLLFAHLHRRQVLVFLVLWCGLGFLAFVVTKNKTFVRQDNVRINKALPEQVTRPEHRAKLLSPRVPAATQGAVKWNGHGVGVDRTPPLSKEQIVERLRSNYSSIPQESWLKTNSVHPERNGCSDDVPSVYDIDFNNEYWQLVAARNATFYLLSAYYDDRPKVGDVPVVRILSMIDKLNPPRVLCQLRYKNVYSNRTRFFFTTASYNYMWRPNWGNYEDGILQPFLITCNLRKKYKKFVPTSVSLVERMCDYPRNNLVVVYRKPPEKRGRFAVCVKYLDFLYEDISVRLVEWLELLSVLGAEKIYLYDLDVHPNISKVLRYYVDKGLVELTHFSLPGHQPNIPGLRHAYLGSRIFTKRQNEIIPYNDCLYKNINLYDFLAVLDVDEVIVPSELGTWNELLRASMVLAKEESRYPRASFDFKNVYFLDDEDVITGRHHHHHQGEIPEYLYMLQHVYRTDVVYREPHFFAKCFHDTRLVISLHNHFPLECFETCITYSVDVSVARLHHYRKDCVDKAICDAYKHSSVRDTTIWRYKDELMRRTSVALSDMGFLVK